MWKDYTKEQFQDECLEFIHKIEKLLIINKLDIDISKIDHLCFRVESIDQYEHFKELFLKWADLLIETTVSFRKISTFKLYSKIKYKNLILDIIELPQPKKNKINSFGFEHAEIVIEDSFEDFIKKYPKIHFEISTKGMKINPELRLSLSEGVNIKFHHLSLENLIKLEK